MLLRGEKAYLRSSTILKRVRIIPAQYAQRAIVNAIEKTYTTPNLIQVFGVPPGIAAAPASRSAADQKPSNTVWSWKLRRDSSEVIPRLNKLQGNERLGIRSL